ncbi:MAG: alpha/beta fold hydrolase [Aggregatilineales bacterium]
MTDLVTIDGVAINTRIVGEPDGMPMLVLHGWGGNIASVAPLQDRLAPLGYYVHALDLPGHGASGLPPDPAKGWGMSDYAALVAHYMDHAGITRARLIGHSFGGRISIVLGADYADRVEQIVLTASAGIRTSPTITQKLRRVAYQSVKRALGIPGLKPMQAKVQQWYWDRYASADYKAAGPLKPTFLRVVQEDLAPCAAKIKAPTLLIWGDQDTDTPLWQGQQLEKLIPDAGLVVFKGAGHFAFQERLNDFVRIVDTFFKNADKC